jgi:ribosomal protein S26
MKTLIKNVKCKNCGREIPSVDKSIEYGTALDTTIIDKK